jgi:hypothetical protein
MRAHILTMTDRNSSTISEGMAAKGKGRRGRICPDPNYMGSLCCEFDSIPGQRGDALAFSFVLLHTAEGVADSQAEEKPTTEE